METGVLRKIAHWIGCNNGLRTDDSLGSESDALSCSSGESSGYRQSPKRQCLDSDSDSSPEESEFCGQPQRCQARSAVEIQSVHLSNMLNTFDTIRDRLIESENELKQAEQEFERLCKINANLVDKLKEQTEVSKQRELVSMGRNSSPESEVEALLKQVSLLENIYNLLKLTPEYKLKPESTLFSDFQAAKAWYEGNIENLEYDNRLLCFRAERMQEQVNHDVGISYKVQQQIDHLHREKTWIYQQTKEMNLDFEDMESAE